VAYRAIADLLVLVHALFIVFVVAGGFVAWRWRRIAWIHVPAAAWGAWIEVAGWVCPLTPLENHFRRLAGLDGYAGGFIEHYLVPLIYPGEWTPALRIALATFVLVVNVVAYAVYFRRRPAVGPRNPSA
jgi:hypothetical protein